MFLGAPGRAWSGLDVAVSLPPQSGLDVAVPCPSPHRVLTELVSKMRDMQMDKTELGCLRAIVLFNPGTACCPGLVSTPQGAKAAGHPPQPHSPLIGRCRPPAPPLSLPVSLAMGSTARDLEPGWSGGAGGGHRGRGGL